MLENLDENYYSDPTYVHKIRDWTRRRALGILFKFSLYLPAAHSPTHTYVPYQAECKAPSVLWHLLLSSVHWCAECSQLIELRTSNSMGRTLQNPLRKHILRLQLCMLQSNCLLKLDQYFNEADLYWIVSLNGEEYWGPRDGCVSKNICQIYTQIGTIFVLSLSS